MIRGNFATFMEDTMSNYSFSQQFYKRWTCAPNPVRSAIIQELTDITTLLQTETPFENFVFSTHDLDAHLDELYENHQAELAIEKAISDKQEQRRVAAEKLDIEETQKKVAEEQLKQKHITQKEQNSAERSKADNNDTLDGDTLDNDTLDDYTADDNTDNSVMVTDENIVSVNDTNTETISDKIAAGTASDLSLKSAHLSEEQQHLIRDLEIQIDDYLSEQMLQMSENLKSWLRAEVTQQWAEQAEAKVAVTDTDSIQ